MIPNVMAADPKAEFRQVRRGQFECNNCGQPPVTVLEKLGGKVLMLCLGCHKKHPALNGEDLNQRIVYYEFS
jgi:hypothetical protein